MNLNAVSSGHMASQDEIDRGTYFCRRSFYVVPVARAAELTRDGLQYNGQPDWKLKELNFDSFQEANSAIREFQRFTNEASRQFEWPTAFQPKFKDRQLNKHSWKHVSYADLRSKVDDILHGRGKTLLRNTIFAEPPGDFEELIRKEANSDPKAVARVWHLCQSKENLKRLLVDNEVWTLSNEDLPKLYQSIPTVGELATQYAECIVADRQESDVRAARSNLKKLTSFSSIRGGGRSGGRPKNPVAWADINFVYGMAYGLVRQIRNAEGVLSKAALNLARTVETIRDCLQVELAPDEIKHFVLKSDERGGMDSGKAARLMTARMLSISEGHVQKTVYRPTFPT